MKAKKIIVGILICISAIFMLAALSNVKAEGLGYLKITKERTEVSKFHISAKELEELVEHMPMQTSAVTEDIQTMQLKITKLLSELQDVDKEFTLTYKHQLYHNNTSDTKNVWKIVSCSDANGTENTKKIKDLYCLRAGLGFTTDGNVEASNNVKNYSISYDLISDYDKLKTYFATLNGTQISIFKDENKHDLNAVLWILDNMLLEDADNSTAKKYAETYAGYTDETLTQDIFRENVLTRSDIEVIQQLAIWYFTNKDSTGNNGYHPTDEKLPTLYVDIQDKTSEESAYLYETDDYEAFSDIFNMKVLGNDAQAGTKRQQAAEKLYKKLIDDANKAATEAESKGGLYNPTRDITVYFAGGEAATEQPVVQVKEREPKVDVALRKFITKINGVELKNEDGTFTREPKVDTSKLNDVVDGKLVTTSDYEHTKQPLRVNKGDSITYRLRIYNEGEVDVYITELKDHLSEYLDFNVSDWTKDGGDHTAKSDDSLKVVGVGGEVKDSEIGKNLSQVKIPKAKYESNGKYTLSYVDVEITCTLKDTVTEGHKFTNIAEITGMKGESGTELKNDRDSTPNNLQVPEDEAHYESYKDDEIEKQREEKEPYIPGQEDDDDFEKVYVVEPEVDVALRKFIVKIDDNLITDTETSGFAREPDVDTSKLNHETNGKKVTTSDYKHTKQPLKVNIGSTITYRFRIYNEGEVDLYVTKLTDHLPKQLGYNGSDWVLQSGGQSAESADNLEVVNVGGNIDKNQIGQKLGDVKIPKAEYNANTNDYTLSYVDVEITCKVLDTAKPGEKITNIAEITEMKDENKTETLTKDRDSVPDGVGNPDAEGAKEPLKHTSDEELPTYKDDEIEKQKQGQEPYIPGQEDDDDFEKVYIAEPSIDLSLRKFITAVNGERQDEFVDRIPDERTSSTLGAGKETADYDHSKQPVSVSVGDIITYHIRVYNEGEVDGRVSEIKDYLAPFLEYTPSEQEGDTPWWTEEKGEELNVLTSTENLITVGANISNDETKSNQAIGQKIKDIIIPAYDKEKDILSYIEVEVNCKVLPVTEATKMTNIAEITQELNKDGTEPAEDRDSLPNGDKDNPDRKIPTGDELENYKDPGIDEQEKGTKPYIPGEEDDDDFEKVVVKPKFDLSLRKFITKVENTDVNNRYPTPTMGEDGNIKYVHPKDPVPVASGDTVIYTIRIFNEGEADGFAEEITDDYPEGLEFLVDHEINKEYRWKMLDENEEETNDITKAKYLITDYLSEAQGIENNRDNKIKAFDKEAGLSDTNPDYRDVQIAFKVTYVPTTKEEANRIIVNTAQISKDSDDDIDSEPHRDEVYDKDPEDDIDYDNVIVKYFDLSLLKWVAKTRVTLNGETVETDTGHNAENSKNEPQVKLEVAEKDLNKIVIKYIYTIRVTNEGELEGYADEIKDYIPEGLRFEEADNTEWHWKMQDDGSITTDYFKDTLLKPGDYVEVPLVLTWINDPENLGEKVNLAEISVDRTKTHVDVPDIDSTPNNKKPEEDDIDDAPVILAVKTGMLGVYLGLLCIVLITFATGVSLIKKYVL